tara:strand:- start:16792 stop:17631 length:840 start_codon:yes stop_codon:yes gene_type:complete
MIDSNETLDAVAAEDTSDVSADVVEAAVEIEEVVDEQPLELTFDQLLAAEFDGDPVLGTDEEYTGLPHVSEILKHIPENGRKLVANLRADYSRKTQEMAALRKELQREKDNYLNQQKLLTEGAFADNVRKLASDETSHDIWDEDGRRAAIRQEAAKMMQEMYEPLQQQVATQQRQMQLTSFKQENPDLDQPQIRMEVAKLLQARSELKLEDAYYIVKAKVNATAAKDERQGRVSRRKAGRDALMKTSTGKNVSTKMGKPEGSKDWSAWQWFQYNKNNQK